jgi:preprotein translocase subunit SecY
MASASAMVKTGMASFGQSRLASVFKIKELRQKILITLGFLAVYRVGFHVPVPMIDQEAMMRAMHGQDEGLLGLISMFSGGSLSQSTIFGLGIMPYISASIIFQLLASVYPPLEKLQKEGEAGRKKINEYTRYATVVICLFQAWMWVSVLSKPKAEGGLGLAIPGYDTSLFFYLTTIVIMTTGTVFLMWIGEQIDEYGIGNGISLLIMAGIVCRIPDATYTLFFERGHLRPGVFMLGGSGTGDIGLEKIFVLIFLFVSVVIGVIAMTKAQRRIPTQSAKHVRGRRVYGGTRNFLPLRLNQSGVMPVIFASSLLILPTVALKGVGQLASRSGEPSTLSNIAYNIAFALERQGYLYNICYIVLIYFFCYFWTAITFNPKDIANNLKDYGSFIPGYRPGKRTADYLEKVIMRITYVGAAFLAIVAIIPSLISTSLEVNYTIASFYGGTGLLIVISVALDLVQKINSHLVMRNYPGLTED